MNIKKIFTAVQIVFALFAVIWFLAHQPRTITFSDGTVEYLTSWDQELGGDSRVIESRNDNKGFYFRFRKGDTFLYPYAGGGYASKDTANLIDLSKYSAVKIRCDLDSTNDFMMVLRFYLPGVSVWKKGETHLYRQTEISSGRHGETVTIPFSDFHTPAWWLAVNRLSREEADQAGSSRCSGILFYDHPLAERGKEYSFRIHEVQLVHSFMPELFICLGWIVVMSLAGAVIFRRRTIAYEKIPLASAVETDRDILEQVLNRDYSQVSLSLPGVVKSTGLSESRIRQLLKKYHAMSFKEYITQIRMAEAQRLLKETDRQIVEIALAVGYKHTSTFNALFKETTGFSPTAFRKNPAKKR